MTASDETGLVSLNESRLPPQNEEAEAGLLGAILQNNRLLDRVSEFLRPEHFAAPVNGRIYTAIRKTAERGQIADPVTMKAFFEQDGSLEEIGGTTYLAHLVAAASSAVDIRNYGELIYDLFLRRELIDLGDNVMGEAYRYDPDMPASKQIQDAEQQLFSLAESGAIEGGPKSFSQALSESIEVAESAHKRQGKISGVPSGLNSLDQKLGGLHRSDLLILAGRPSMGKTALATNIAFSAAKTIIDQEESDRTFHVAFFSLEMSAEQLATRILSEQTSITSEKIRRGELDQKQFDKIVVTSQKIEATPFFIDDTPAITVSTLRSRARKLKRQHGLDMLVVDYLQLMQGESRDGNRVQEISNISRGLKTIAKELQIPVIALSQLSRAVEQRDNKRPQLADLRESGAIEQDADVVMFVYREEYYLSREEPAQKPEESQEKFNERYAAWQNRLAEVQSKADIIIAKQRHGPIGTVTVHFDGSTTRFSNLVEDEHLPEAI